MLRPSLQHTRPPATALRSSAAVRVEELSDELREFLKKLFHEMQEEMQDEMMKKNAGTDDQCCWKVRRSF